MSEDGYLYFIYDVDGSIGYVGIGDRARPYEPHTPEVDALRDRSGDVRITSSPFSERDDAKLAESLLIRALADAATTAPRLLNSTEIKQSHNLVPLLPFKNATLKYSDLSETLLVKIRLNRIDDERVVVSGAAHPVDAAERCRKWWSLGNCVASKAPIKQLVTVTTAEVNPPRIIGVWRTDDPQTWSLEPDGGAVTLPDPSEGDVGGHVGKIFEWEGYRVTGSIAYSNDVREFLGLRHQIANRSAAARRPGRGRAGAAARRLRVARRLTVH